MWLPDDGSMWTEICWSSFYNFNYFNNLRILQFVCNSWTIKYLILDMMTFETSDISRLVCFKVNLLSLVVRHHFVRGRVCPPPSPEPSVYKIPRSEYTALIICNNIHRIPFLTGGTAEARWLRCYVTNWKVAGSIPDGHWNFSLT